MNRPDYMKCVQTGMADEKFKPWCGVSNGFRPFFVDATHAALNGLQGGRLVACPECVEAITKALRNGVADHA